VRRGRTLLVSWRGARLHAAPTSGARATAAGAASALEHRAHVLEVRDERVPVGLGERLLGGVLGVTVGGRETRGLTALVVGGRDLELERLHLGEQLGSQVVGVLGDLLPRLLVGVE